MDIAAYQEGNTLSSPSELGCERWSTALVWFKSLYNLLQSFINCRSWSLAIHGRENVFISSQLVLGYFLGQHSIKARTVACSWHRKRFNVFGFDTGFHCSQHQSLRRIGHFSAMVSFPSLIIISCASLAVKERCNKETHILSWKLTFYKYSICPTRPSPVVDSVWLETNMSGIDIFALLWAMSQSSKSVYHCL